jgi:hypothetical protein
LTRLYAEDDRQGHGAVVQEAVYQVSRTLTSPGFPHSGFFLEEGIDGYDRGDIAQAMPEAHQGIINGLYRQVMQATNRMAQACPSHNDRHRRHHSEYDQPFMICWN